jgi:hypothetical protein
VDGVYHLVSYFNMGRKLNDQLEIPKNDAPKNC